MKVLKLLPICLVLVMLCGCSPKSEQKIISSLDELSSIDDIIKAEAVELDPVYDGHAIEYKIRYKSDDCEVVGYIAAPTDYLEKEYPILIYNRGGNRNFGKLEDSDIATIATGDYIAMGSQYRGIDGGTGKEEFGGKDINDVIKLIDISESFGFAKKGGVYMLGASRGGMMTYLASSMDSRIKAAAVLAGVSDVAASYNDRGGDMKSVLNELIGGSPDEKPEEYEKRSAVNWADKINVPMLIIHGGVTDWRVNTQQARDMASALEKAGKEYKLIIYEEADHSLDGTNSYLDAFDWFDSHPLE